MEAPRRPRNFILVINLCYFSACSLSRLLCGDRRQLGCAESRVGCLCWVLVLMLAQSPRFAFPCGEHGSSSMGREVEPFRMQLPFPYPLSQGLSKAFSQIHSYYCPSTLTSDSSDQNSDCKLLQFRPPKPVCLPGHKESGWTVKAFYLHCGNAPSLGSLSETSHQSAGEYLRNQYIRLLH